MEITERAAVVSGLLGLRPHRAAYDVLVTARLFVSLASQFQDAAALF
jgi:hypothetical protein